MNKPREKKIINNKEEIKMEQLYTEKEAKIKFCQHNWGSLDQCGFCGIYKSDIPAEKNKKELIKEKVDELLELYLDD